MPSIVNPQITDAVTQSSVKLLGDGPGLAMGLLFQATAQSMANTAHNASSAQQNSNSVIQASSTQGIAMLHAVDTAAESASIQRILGSARTTRP